MIEIAKIKNWDYKHALLMVLAGIGTLYFQTLSILLLVATFSFVWFVILYLKKNSFIGYANLVTLFRLGLLLFLGFILFKIPAWLALTIGLIVLILDGIDGYVARRFKESSHFGAYLDMETDTIFVCLFCTYYYLENLLEAWILFIGFMRYIYIGLILIFKLQNRKEKSTRFAKTIAVILFSALLSPLVFPPFIYFPAMVVAGILVLYSFGLSFWGLFSGVEEQS